MFPKSSAFHLVIILSVATVLCLPCIFYGIPTGFNTRNHINYQHHFSRQFWEGDVYPRWLAGMNKGYGSPVFLMQYPLPYVATALLRPFTSFAPEVRDTRELGLFLWLALAAAGVAAWVWLRQLTGPRGALLGALFYISMPYLLCQAVYVRVATGELAALVWMPLALGLCDWMYRRVLAALAVSAVLALLIFSNFFSAVLFAPAFLAYAIVAGRRRGCSLFHAARVAFLVELFGAALSGAYLIPMLAYRRLFDLHQLAVLLPGYRLGYYFLGISSNSLNGRIALALSAAAFCTAAAAWYCWHAQVRPGMRIAITVTLLLSGLLLIPGLGTNIVRLGGFDLGASPAADYTAKMSVCILLTSIFAFVAYCSLSENPSDQRPLVLLCIATGVFFFMLPYSAPVWKAVPATSAMQFPFRLGGIQSVAVAALGAMAFDRRRGKRMLAISEAAALIVCLGGISIWRIDESFRHPATPPFDVSKDVDTMYRTYVPPEQVATYAESLGTSPETYLVNARPGDGEFRFHLVRGDCRVNVAPESARQIRISSDCSSGGLVQIGQTHFPLWRIIYREGDRGAPGISAEGLNEVPLPSGKQELRLVFDAGSAERWGAIVSGVSLAGLIGLALFTRGAARSGLGFRLKSQSSDLSLAHPQSRIFRALVRS